MNVPSNLIRIPLVRQSTTYTCGVTALQSVMGYYNHYIREDLLAAEVKCTPEHGTSYLEMKKYVESQGFEFQFFLPMTEQQLELEIDKGNPIIVALQAWTEDHTIPWEKKWEDGHYAVLIGYDEKKYYFMDPSTFGHYAYIERNEFLERWHDIDEKEIKVIHLGIKIKSDEFSTYNPLNVKKIG